MHTFHNTLSRRGGILLLVLLIAGGAWSQSFMFAQLTGTPVNTAGWRFEGGAYRGNTGTNTGNGEIILTNAVLRTSGAIFYNAPINLAVCRKWVAEFEFRMAGGNGADGMTFCYLENPPSGFVNGGGLGVPDTAKGLKVCIDTWHNECENQMPKLQLRWGTGYKECPPDPSQPTFLNSTGELSNLTNGQYHTARISYDGGNITFSVNGKQYLTAFQALNFPGYFGFTASTGAASNQHSIRNVKIYTDMPDTDAGPARQICSGGAAQLGPAAVNPIFGYKWSPAAGLSNPNIQNPQVTLTHAGATPSVVKYYMTTENLTIPGCSSLDSVLVTVYPLPQATFSATNLCFNDTVTITPATQWPDSIARTVTWNWSFNDPGVPGGGQYTGLVGRHRYSAPGTYTVGAVATTREGCTQAFTTSAALRNLPPTAFEAVNTGNVCINEAVLFVHRSNTGSNKGATLLVPDISTPATNIRYNQLLRQGDTVKVNYRQLRLQEGKPFYVAQWFNTDEFGCTGTARDTVYFRAQPQLSLGVLQGVCLNAAPFPMQGGTENSGLPGNGYYTGRGVSSTTGIFDPAAAGVGTHAIRYIYQAQNGCVDTVSRSQSVFALPIVDAGPNKAFLPGGSAILEGSSSISPRTVQWTPVIGLSNPAVLRPAASPPADQRYYLLVTTADGCTGRDSVEVRSLPALTIPNAFSPHLPDAINDVWIIRNLDLFPGAIIQVFDRYGRKVLNSTGYNKPWDGKVNGILLPVGVYYYIIDPKNGNKTYAGSVTIL